MNVLEMRTKAAMLLARCQELAEQDGMTEEQKAEFDGKLAEAKDLDAKIGQADEIGTLRKSYTQGDGAAHVRQVKTEPPMWKGLEEFLRDVLTKGPQHPMFDVCRAEAKELNMTVGAQGAVLVPQQFSDMLLQVKSQDAVVRPRARVIPAGDPPDAPITMPALNQSGALGVYSGVTVQWIAEGATKIEAEPSFAEITLAPQEVSAWTELTDKLIRNSAAASAIVTTLLRKAIIASEDVAFLRGGGAGQPLGIIGAPGTLVVARTGAGAVVYADLIGMYARALMGGNLTWVANPTVLPQLMTMVDAGGNLIWQPNAREGTPGTLLGIPLIINQRSPVLGTSGDILLADFDYYLIKDGSGIFVESSSHFLFTSNRTIIKAFWNVDGQPWLTTPMLLEDGVTTSSPFVVLS